MTNRNNFDVMKQRAQKEATKYQCDIAVVYAPIENAEEYDGDYGYCPPRMANIIYKWGEIVCICNPE